MDRDLQDIFSTRDALKTSCKAAGGKLIASRYEEVKDFLRYSGAHGKFSLKSGTVDPEANVLRVVYEQYRNDPMFDDYTGNIEVPLEYFESPDPKHYIASLMAEDTLKRKQERQKEKDEKIQKLKYEIGYLERELKKLIEEY